MLAVQTVSSASIQPADIAGAKPIPAAKSLSRLSTKTFQSVPDAAVASTELTTSPVDDATSTSADVAVATADTAATTDAAATATAATATTDAATDVGTNTAQFAGPTSVAGPATISAAAPESADPDVDVTNQYVGDDGATQAGPKATRRQMKEKIMTNMI